LIKSVNCPDELSALAVSAVTAGAEIRVLKDLMGHYYQRMTSRYAQVWKPLKVDAAKRIDALRTAPTQTGDGASDPVGDNAA
jgi:hypothetical protein